MTDTLIDHADSGEIPRLPGETRMRIDTGEKTVRIDPRILDAPSYEAIPRRVIEIDDTVQFRIPETIGLAGPQSPPPPLPPIPPPPKYDLAAAQPVAPWERVADTEQLTGSLGADLPEVPFPPKLRKSVPYVLPAGRAPWAGPRHAAPAPLWARLSIAAGLSLLLGSTLGLAVLAVIR